MRKILRYSRNLNEAANKILKRPVSDAEEIALNIVKDHFVEHYYLTEMMHSSDYNLKVAIEKELKEKLICMNPTSENVLGFLHSIENDKNSLLIICYLIYIKSTNIISAVLRPYKKECYNALMKLLGKTDEEFKALPFYKETYNKIVEEINDYNNTDINEYYITDDDWLQMLEYMNKGLTEKSLYKKVKDKRQWVAFYFISKVLGWNQAYQLCTRMIYPYILPSKGELKAYEECYKDLQIPESVQDILDDLKTNCKCGVYYNSKNLMKQYSDMPATILKMLENNIEIFDYEIIPAFTNKLTIKLNTSIGELYFSYFNDNEGHKFFLTDKDTYNKWLKHKSYFSYAICPNLHSLENKFKENFAQLKAQKNNEK